MDELKLIISKNIAALRQGARLTQAEFAEQLNYSDKAVSKWERGESVPDVSVLKTIADKFGVTVDWLLREHENEAPAIPGKEKNKNRKRIAFLSVLCVWLVATVVFSLLLVITGSAGEGWLAFVAAVPASAILLIIFNSIWGSVVNNKYWISLLVWSFIAFLYLLLLVCADVNFYMLFVIGVPLQIAVIVWHKMLK